MPAHAYPVLFAVLLACITVNAAAQEIYKDMDDEGGTTFSDQPPVKKVSTPRRGGKVDAKEAARRLEQARLERRLGAAPRPGELIPAAGGLAVNYRYWKRQEKLRVVVERALRRSNETQRVQVASR